MRLMHREHRLSATVGVLAQEVTYFFGEATTSLRRNGLMSVAAVTTVLVTLLAVGAAFLGVVNLAHLTRTLDAQVEIVAFLADGLPAGNGMHLQRTIEALPNVTTVRFVNRADALKRLQARLGGTAAFADMTETNPLQDSLEIRIVDPGSVEGVATAIRRLRGVAEVSFGGQVVERLTALTRGVRLLAGVTVALLGAVAVIIVVNTVRLTVIARRTEIEIMELVGATRWFIRWPFLIEGMLQGAIAATAAVGVLATAYALGVHRLDESLPFLPTMSLPQVFLPLVAVVGTMGIALGAAGSALAVRRFLSP